MGAIMMLILGCMGLVAYYIILITDGVANGQHWSLTVTGLIGLAVFTGALIVAIRIKVR